MIDAPVSGGEPKAVDGTLAIMVGGAAKDFEKAKPLLLRPRIRMIELKPVRIKKGFFAGRFTCCPQRKRFG